MSRNEYTTKHKVVSGLALVALGGVIIVTLAASPSHPTSATSTSTSQNSVNNAEASNTSYKDGTYSATGTYNSPGGNEKLHVTLTLSDNTVSAATVQAGANDPTAVSYQSAFISGYKPFVVGKKISDINITNVSGSSLTSQGFDNALQQIEQQAKA